MTDSSYKTSSGEGEGSLSAIRTGIREMEPIVAQLAAFSETLVILTEDTRVNPNTLAVLSAELNLRATRVRDYHVALLGMVNGT